MNIMNKNHVIFKKAAAIFLIVAFSFSALAGCGGDSEEAAEAVLQAQYDECLSALNSAESESDMKSYLIDFANKNDIKVSYDKKNNVIMSKAAAEGYDDAESTIFQCTVDLSDKEMSALSMSTIEYILLNSDAHGFIRALFTTEGGVSGVSDHYLTASNFISLDWHESGKILVGSAGSEYYTMHHELSWTAPSYTHAYKIEVTGPDGISCSESNHPNPIRIIGNLLAQAQSKGILLEIADFSGGTSADTYPANVSCTILVNQNDITKLEKRLQNAKESFDEKYASAAEEDGDDESGESVEGSEEAQAAYTFSYELTDTPERVIAYDDASNLISFLYTCISGTYLKDDAGEVIALSNTGSIKTSDDGLTIEICALSKNSDVLSEMNTVYDTVCGLCDIAYEKKDGLPVWENLSSSENVIYDESETLESASESASPLVNALSESYTAIFEKDAKTKRTFEKTACSYAAQKIKSMNVAAFGITEENHLSETEVLLNYLENQK